MNNTEIAHIATAVLKATAKDHGLPTSTVFRPPARHVAGIKARNAAMVAMSQRGCRVGEISRAFDRDPATVRNAIRDARKRETIIK